MTVMRRWTIRIFGVLAVVAGTGVAYLYAAYPATIPAEDLRIEATLEKLARGRYLFDHVAGCADCHSTRD